MKFGKGKELIKKVRATLFKEIIMDVECELCNLEGYEDRWIPKDTNLLLDAVRDNGQEFDFDYDVVR